VAFSNKSDQEAMSEINVTPLVDVMLVLLVVFIVTAPLLTQSVRVTLPKTVVTAPAPQDHLADVSIDAQGEVYLNTQRVTIESLGQQLADLLGRDADLMVQFNADANVNYGKVAQVMAIAHHAGISKLSFLTQEQ
jgi:biopolymer transport protein ExbD